MNLIKKILNSIEAKRESKNFLFLGLVFLKDVLWCLTYFIPFHTLLAIQNIKQRFLLRFLSLFKMYRDPVEKYYKISFCITCMNRLKHLKRTLKRNIKYNKDYPNLEFVLLDYNSADDLQNWVLKNFKKELADNTLAYYKTTKPQYFHMANAKNIAHNLASGDIVCNLDADNYTGKDFAFYINQLAQDSLDVIGIHRNDHRFFPSHISDCGGRVFLSKNNFIKLGGYNEKFKGWGLEDVEFKKRADILGLKFIDIPRIFLGAITHNNKLRVKNMNTTIKQTSPHNGALVREAIANAKYHIDNEPIDFNEIKRIK